MFRAVKPATVKLWALPAALGTLLALGLFFGFFSPVRLRVGAPAQNPQTLAPSIVFATPEQRDRDRQEVTDLEPLFLPTRRNASVLSLPAQASRELGSMGSDFPPNYSISESSGGVNFPDLVPVPGNPVQVLSLGEPPNPWPEVGRADINVPTFPARLAFIEVRLAKSGQPVLSEAIASSALPSGMPTADWAPLEFLVAVDSIGLVGAPVSTGSTTSDEVESFFRNFIVRGFQLGARLSPGFYSVRVGP